MSFSNGEKSGIKKTFVSCLMQRQEPGNATDLSNAAPYGSEVKIAENEELKANEISGGVE